MAAGPAKRRTRTLADLVDGCIDKAVAAQGFAGADVILSWDDIVGERLARHSQPIKMDWPRRFQPGADSQSRAGTRPDAATLVVRVESAFAIELQHTAPLVMERVNAHYGWRCVGRLVLKQGPVKRALPSGVPRPALSAESRARLDAATDDVEDAGLRAALDRLGSFVLTAAGSADPR